MKKLLFYSIASILSLAFGFTALADAPLPPSSITATSTTPTSVNLSWATSTGAVSYQIFRNSTSTPIATTTGLSYVDTGLTPTTTYTYYLASVDASSTVSALSTSTAVTTLAVNPAPSTTTPSTTTPSVYIMNTGWGNKQINVRSNQIVKIVILGNANFNVRDIDNNTVMFGGSKKISQYRWYMNRDGRLDIVYSFRTADMKDLNASSTNALFTATTKSGQVISAELPIKIKNTDRFWKHWKAPILPKKIETEREEEKIEQAFENKIENAQKQKESQLNKLKSKIKKIVNKNISNGKNGR